MNWLKKIFYESEKNKKSLEKSLEKSNRSFFEKLTRTFAGKTKVNEEILDNLEEILISSDIGVATTIKIIERIEKKVGKDKYSSAQELDCIIREEIKSLLIENQTSIQNDIRKKNPYVIMVVGVNGVGKTTTIAKLASQFKTSGLKVLLGAADTFRAAAIDQLVIWSELVQVPIIKHAMGSDPASVAFDSVQSALKRKSDVVLIDTAGRLHNKINLMNELSKITRVIQKVIPDAPHEVLLVLDGSIGQNAFEQAKQFTKATKVSAFAITKLDGTAKGGVAIGISDQFKIPIKYIGIGEKIEDLQFFDPSTFVESFFKRN